MSSGDGPKPGLSQVASIIPSVSTPLLSVSPSSIPTLDLPAGLPLRLYTSHFLSTWNSRLFEFASVLFLAHIYPSNLSPLSVYALCRSTAGILFSRLVGHLVDTRGRLAVVRASIVVQRIVVAASCAVFLVLEGRARRGVLDGGLSSDADHGIAGRGGHDWATSIRTMVGLGEPTNMARAQGNILFVVLVILACVEKLSSIANLVAVERDWVVVITEQNEDARRTLNSRLRRIDLICKLVGPLLISLLDGVSPRIAIWTTLGTNMASVIPEYVCISTVYHMAPSLRRSSSPASPPSLEQSSSADAPESSPGSSNSLSYLARSLLPITSLPFYFHHSALLPSLSLSLLYLTVLSFSGQMITFLLFLGYTPLLIGTLRTASTIFELSATWIAPRLMFRLGVIRAGIWSLSWQMLWLAVGTCWFFTHAGPELEAGRGASTASAASGLVAAVILSRVGLWGFDLCAQMIVQDEVQHPHRGAFSAVETSFQNLFEMLSFASTIIFSRPDQFRWPIVLSVATTYLAGGLYTWFVRRRRGHLFHKPRCICPRTHPDSPNARS